ncbi:MAG: hypothetical protein JO145_01305 [Acidobacteriaceae bacterium]|nr:hypothetical protein [Acidobacteriaceae bacterium]
MPAGRALWVWAPDGSAELLRFAKKESITDLFVQWSTEGDKHSLRGFIRMAREENIRVYALDGSPEAALAENHGRVLKEVDAIAAFNESSQPEERLAGIHFDIEPYLLAGFDGRAKSQILSEYVDLQRKVAAEVHLHKAAGLSYGIDLPFWFDRDVVERVLPFVDTIAIMDYRNHASGEDGIVAHALPILGIAQMSHRKVFVGVETAPASLPTISFAGWTKRRMEQEVEDVIRELAGEPAFAGIAIHDYAHYRALQQ